MCYIPARLGTLDLSGTLSREKYHFIQQTRGILRLNFLNCRPFQDFRFTDFLTLQHKRKFISIHTVAHIF